MGKYLAIADRVLGELQPPRETGPRNASREPLWWEGPPWNGEITQGEFQAVIAAYITRYGAYSPELPRREPDVLVAWIADRASRCPLRRGTAADDAQGPMSREAMT